MKTFSDFGPKKKNWTRLFSNEKITRIKVAIFLRYVEMLLIFQFLLSQALH